MTPRIAPRPRVRSLLSVLLALLLPAALMAPTAAIAAGVSATATITSSSPQGLSIEVRGTGYATGEANPQGVYVALGERASLDPTDATAYVKAEWVQASGIAADGSFTRVLALDAAGVKALDRTKLYSVYTLRAHGQAANDPSQNAEVPVAIDFATLAEPEPEPEPEPAADPSVTVSRTVFSTEGSATVTVEGKNFDPASATGTRPPLAGKPGGAYVVFGKFAEVWRPSAGAASSSRVNTSQKWAVSKADMPGIGGDAAGAVELRADGSFTAELVVDKAAIDAKATAASLVNYGIYTYPGSGAVQAKYETYTPVTFTAPEPPAPTLDVEVTEQRSGSLKVQVDGAGYTTTGSPGVYLGIAESGGASAVDASVYRGAVFVPAAAMGPGGTFSRTLTLDATAIGTLSVDEDYSVYSLKAHGQAATDPSQTVEVPLDVDVALLQSTPEPAGPTLTAEVVEQVPGSLKVDVSGAGYRAEAPGVYVAIAPSGGASPTNPLGYLGTQWVQHTAYGPGGTFDVQLALGPDAIATLDPATEYSVYTLKAHGQAATDPTQTVETPLDLDVALLQGDDTGPVDPTDPEPSGATLATNVLEQAKGVLTVRVHGRGYKTSDSPGVYVGISESGGASAVDAAAYRGAIFVPSSAMAAGGVFTRTISLSAADIATLDVDEDYSVYTLKAHGQAASDPSQTREKRLDLDVALIRDGVEPTPPTTPTNPGTPATPPTSGGGQSSSRTAGSLTWGVASDFRSYVTGPIAKGSVSVSNGATAGSGGYRFFQRTSQATGRDARGATGYGGTVTFSGHAGALNLRLADPTVTVGANGRGTLSVVVDGSRRDFATLDLRAARVSRSGEDVTYSGAPATLTAGGASAFQGFYAAGRALDPVTFTVGRDTAAPVSGGARTVASAPQEDEDEFVPPATPPATTGAALDVEDEDAIRAGDRITVSAEGFEADESDIAVVVYSTPVVLARDASADAAGRVTWTGNLPGDLEPGEHTLTFQGSVSRGVVFTVTDEEVERCEIGGATLTWGVKESFRSYVSGSIANGDWTTSGGATYETPVFTFADGEGTFDGETFEGEVAFDGAIEFTGHDGALAVTLADPQVRLTDEDTAVLFLDVTAGARAAAEAGDATTTTTEGVPFAELDLSAGERSDSDEVELTGVPATLTEQGHQVFDSYEAGAELDPVDLTIVAGEDCASAAEPVVVPADGDAGDDQVSIVPTSGGTPVGWWVGGGLAALVLVGAGLWAVRRRGGAA